MVSGTSGLELPNVGPVGRWAGGRDDVAPSFGGDLASIEQRGGETPTNLAGGAVTTWTLDATDASREGWDFETKEADHRDGRSMLPEDFWPTYSAMANSRTRGT
jgi:hypothetical protein